MTYCFHSFRFACIHVFSIFCGWIVASSGSTNLHSLMYNNIVLINSFVFNLSVCCLSIANNSWTRQYPIDELSALMFHGDGLAPQKHSRDHSGALMHQKHTAPRYLQRCYFLWKYFVSTISTTIGWSSSWNPPNYWGWFSRNSSQTSRLKLHQSTIVWFPTPVSLWIWYCKMSYIMSTSLERVSFQKRS